MESLRSIIFILILCIFNACSQAPDSNRQPKLKLTIQESGTDALLVGVSAINNELFGLPAHRELFFVL